METNGKRKRNETNWTESDGKRLQELFDNGSLSLTDTIAKVVSLDKYFAKFKERTLAGHLGSLRKRNAPFVALSSRNSSPSPDNVASNEISDADECGLICDNMPFVCFTYTDASDEQEKIVVLLDLPGGSRSYEWEFNDLGDSITIRVEWSRALCDVSSMFASASNDPKLQAMHDALSREGISRKKIPKCCIQVSLGRKVCKDDDSWEVSIIKHEGNKILMIEFSEYSEKALKKIKRGNFADD